MFRRKYRILRKGLICKSSSVASNQMIYETRWYNKRIFIKGYSVPREFSWIENYKLTRRNKQHECHTSATWKTRVRHEWKVLILITTRVKTYFHTPILAIGQMKDYKERNNFIQEVPFENVSLSCQNAFEKCTTKTGLCNGYINYIKKLYIRLSLQMPLHVPTK